MRDVPLCECGHPRQTHGLSGTWCGAGIPAGPRCGCLTYVPSAGDQATGREQ